MSAAVAPVSRSTAVQACADALRGAIVRDEMPAGSRLPAEPELAARLGVSRLTLRSAVTTLVGEGLITVKHGSGMRVRDYRRSGGPGLLSTWFGSVPAAAQADAVADLLAVRRAVASVVLQRVVQRVRCHDETEGLRAFDAAIAAFASCADALPHAGDDDDLTTIARLDLEVLSSIVALAHSPALHLLLNPIADAVVAMPTLRRALYRAPSRNLEGFRIVRDALVALHAMRGTSSMPAPIEDEAVAALAMSMLADNDAATIASLRAAAAPGQPLPPSFPLSSTWKTP